MILENGFKIENGKKSRLTIYDIKAFTVEKQPYFFTRDSMRFFNQTMKMYSIKYSPKGRVFIYAPSYWFGNLMGYTSREFISIDKGNGNLVSIDGLKDKKDLSELLAYIQAN